MAAPFSEWREKTVDPLQIPATRAGARDGGRDEILLNCQGRKDVASFGDKADSRLRNSERRQPDKRQSVESGCATLRRQQSHECKYCSCLAHAVASDQGDNLAGTDREADVE